MVSKVAKNRLNALTFESFISKTYGYMFSSILITSIVAFLMLYTNMVMNLFSIKDGRASLNILGYIAFYGPFFALLGLSFKGIESFSLRATKTIFFSLSVMFGLMMSILVLNTNIGVVFQSLLGAGAIFAGSSLIGQYIKHDLSFIGRIAYSLIFGIIIASVIALIIGSPFSSVIISYIVIVLSAVLVSYTHQNLKYVYTYFKTNSEESEKIAIFGALSLYVDFINIFTSLLNILDRK